jgi:hypothetical protein
MSFVDAKITGVGTLIVEDQSQQNHDDLRDAYVRAVRDSANLSMEVLQNSMHLNRQANLTGPLSPERAQFLDGLVAGAKTALHSRNWTALEPAAKALAKATFDYALQTGGDAFPGRYRNATLAWAASTVALSGDDSTAEGMVLGLELESHIYGFLNDGFANRPSPGPVLISLTVQSASNADLAGTLSARVRDSLGREQFVSCGSGGTA